MARLFPEDSRSLTFASRIGAGVAASALMAAAVAAEVVTGPDTFIFPIYLLPLAIVTWFIGVRWGMGLSVLIPLLGLAVRALERQVGVVDVWNTGMLLGVCLAFCLLLGHIQTSERKLRLIGTVNRAVLGTAVGACLVAGAALLVQQNLLARQRVKFQRQAEPGVVLLNRSMSEPLSGARASRALAQIAGRMHALRSASRPVLLGSRDPNLASCVAPVLTGEVTDQLPANPGDVDGGPGTKMGVLYLLDRRSVANSEMDLVWHQTRLRTWLENLSALNQPAHALARQLAAEASSLADGIAAWSAFPSDFSAPAFTDTADWPSYCLARLSQAVASRDLPATRRWADECAAGLFAMEDIHRWLAFLVDNHLTALDFQRQCAPLFLEEGMKIKQYDLQMSIGFLPGGVIGLHGMTNYYEVERQAEGVYATSRFSEDASIAEKDWNREAVWMPPSVRRIYAKLAEDLGKSNRELWKQAPRAAYERSFLANMLYRASATDTVDALREALRRFDRANPTATLQQLMDAIVYRGHNYAAIEWADRYHPALMQLSGNLQGDDLSAFLGAAAWTNSLYREGKYGLTHSLRQAIDSRTLDCVRATDMIGTLYRNSGHSRFGHVFWSAGTSCHAVAAYLGRDGNQTRTLLLDGLDLKPQPEVWPSAYFNGHEWPSNMRENAPMYSAELFIRGLDNYVWAEGYIVRGPKAGTLLKAPIPYSQIRVEKSAQRVFNGPYPN